MHDPTVIVGFDESASARTALAWAADWTRRTGARLRIIHVLAPDTDLITTWYPGSRGWVPIPSSGGDPDTQRRRITDLVSNIIGDHPARDLEFAEGAVGPALVEAARNAALLIVGTRKLHGISRILDGSVSHYCLSHSRCPVLAVPAVPSSEPNLPVEGDRARGDADPRSA